MRLNIETRHRHADVDEPWLDLLRPGVGRADYLAQLVRMYGFVAPFESACRYTPNLPRVLELYQLSRAGLIAHDLLSLGLSASQVANVPQCHSITIFKDIPEALGWLYVIERATLLHDGLRRRLLAHIPELEDACSYLAACDGRASGHWQAFGRLLDRQGSRPEAAAGIVSAAHAGFERARQWFRDGASAARRSTG